MAAPICSTLPTSCFFPLSQSCWPCSHSTSSATRYAIFSIRARASKSASRATGLSFVHRGCITRFLELRSHEQIIATSKLVSIPRNIVSLDGLEAVTRKTGQAGAPREQGRNHYETTTHEFYLDRAHGRSHAARGSANHHYPGG